MRKLFLSFILVLPLISEASMQPINRQGRPVADRANADFMRNLREDGYYRDYTLSEILHREGWIIDDKPEGMHTYYFPEGARKGVKYYEAGIKTGLWQWWYPNGQLKEEGRWIQFESDNGQLREHFAIESFWRSNGKQWLENGTGRYEAHNDDGIRTQSGKYQDGLRHGEWVNYNPDGSIQFQETYVHGELTEGLSFADDQQYTYKEIRTMPRPPESWQQHLQNHMEEEPAQFRVRVLVSDSGQLSDIQIISAPEGRHEDIENVLQRSPEWIPAKFRGIPVEQRRTLTLTL